MAGNAASAWERDGLTVREATGWDLTAIAACMRPADVAECRAMGHTPYQALILGCAAGMGAEIAEDATGAFVAFGVTPVSLMDGIGRPWALGTPRVGAHRKALLTLARAWLARTELIFPRLENWVGRQNTPAIRVLERLGFVLDEEISEIGGVAFRRFSKGF